MECESGEFYARCEAERGILCEAETNRRPGFDVGDGFYLGHFDCLGLVEGLLPCSVLLL